MQLIGFGTTTPPTHIYVQHIHLTERYCADAFLDECNYVCTITKIEVQQDKSAKTDQRHEPWFKLYVVVLLCAPSPLIGLILCVVAAPAPAADDDSDDAADDDDGMYL